MKKSLLLITLMISLLMSIFSMSAMADSTLEDLDKLDKILCTKRNYNIAGVTISVCGMVCTATASAISSLATLNPVPLSLCVPAIAGCGAAVGEQSYELNQRKMIIESIRSAKIFLNDIEAYYAKTTTKLPTKTMKILDNIAGKEKIGEGSDELFELVSIIHRLNEEGMEDLVANSIKLEELSITELMVKKTETENNRGYSKYFDRNLMDQISAYIKDYLK